MKTNKIILIGAAIIPLFAGCASQPVHVSTVGPAAASAGDIAGSGYLRVYSATKMHVIAENTYYYPHSAYTIYNEAGGTVKFVRNHTGSTDEAPALVTLPAGKYTIVAQSESYGRVTVPVIVQGGKTTVVHLDRKWSAANAATDGAPATTNDLVRLPDGEPVGWKTN